MCFMPFFRKFQSDRDTWQNDLHEEPSRSLQWKWWESAKQVYEVKTVQINYEKSFLASQNYLGGSDADHRVLLKTFPDAS